MRELREPEQGVGGDLLLLAASTVQMTRSYVWEFPPEQHAKKGTDFNTMVQQTRQSMILPAECPVNWPTDVRRNPLFQQNSEIRHLFQPPTPQGYIELTLSGFWSF